MGARYVNLREKGKGSRGRWDAKRKDSAAFVLALRGIPVTKPMHYLCDNQALLKAVNRLVG